jgi:hypothetical protein
MDPDNDIDNDVGKGMLRADTTTAWPDAQIYYEIKKNDFSEFINLL